MARSKDPEAALRKRRATISARAAELLRHRDGWIGPMLEDGRRWWYIGSRSEVGVIRRACASSCSCPQFQEVVRKYGTAESCKHMMAVQMAEAADRRPVMSTAEANRLLTGRNDEDD